MSEEQRNSGEIDLADAFSVIFRWRKFIIMLMIVSGVFALGVSLAMTRTYAVTSILELGQIQVNSGYAFVEPPEAAADRVKGIAKSVYREAPYRASAAFSVQNDFRVKAAKQSGILETELQAPKESDAIAFMEAVNKRFIQDHNRIFLIEKQRVQTEIGNLVSQLEEHKGKKASYENLLKAQVEEERFLKDQIEGASGQLEEILKMKLNANLDAENEPLGQLLFTNEMQRIQAHRDQLSARLMSEIPREKEEARSRIEELADGIRRVSNNLEMKRVQMANMIETSVLLPPRFPEKPVFPRTRLNIVLGMLAGILTAIFLSFFIEFFRSVRQRMQMEGRSRPV